MGEAENKLRCWFIFAVIVAVVVFVFMWISLQPSPKNVYSNSMGLVKPMRLVSYLRPPSVPNDGTPALDSTIASQTNSSMATQSTLSQPTNSSLRPVQTPMVSRPQSTTTQPPTTTKTFLAPKLPSWKPGSFCEDFIDHTLHQLVPVCGPKVSLDRASISCFKSPRSTHMGTCLIRNLAVEPMKLPLKPINPAGNNAISLIDDLGTQCPHITVDGVKGAMEGGDYAKRYVEELQTAQPKHHTVCENWINKTAYFYLGASLHIYFKTLGWYNLHKSLLNNNAIPGDFIVVRLNDPENYKLGDFEKILFPETIVMTELPNVTTCFQKVVLAPQCYAAVPFRCKMERDVKPSCFNCDGRGLYGSTLLTFRERVLKACSFSDLTPEQWKTKKSRTIVVLLRKFYQRWVSDTPEKFQRVLSNSDELLKGLRESFPSTNVTAVYMEDLSICEQIRSTHNADVLMGVHGAGLVHLWWLQDESVIVELEPPNQAANPSFRMLSTLAGRKYHRVTISSVLQKLTVKVDDVVKKLKSITDLN